MKNFLKDEERQELREAHRRERDRRVADRIKVVIAKDKGWTYRQIADILMIDEETASQHVADFLESKKLKPENGGSKCSLSDEQLVALEKHLDEYTYTKVKDICVYVAEKYKVYYSVGAMTQLLHRMGFTYKKPKETPRKADPEKQLRFIEEYGKLKATTPENEPILFIDAVHPTMATKLTYGWIKKGDDKLIPSTASRTRINLVGAIQLKDLRVITQEFDTINTDSMKEFLKTLKAAFPDAPKIHFLSDQAGYNKSHDLQEFAKEIGVEIHLLPPYSPNLNSIERLWKVMNEHVRNNQYFASPEDLRKSIKFFFENILDSIRESLFSRINDHFNIVKKGPTLKSASSC